MKNSALRALALLFILTCVGAPFASASFLWFGPHYYFYHGHYYSHRKWVPANANFAGFYRYYDLVPPPPPRHLPAPNLQ